MKRHVIEGPRHVIERDDAEFPKALRDIRKPPERLYVIGDPTALESGLAVIGARKATPYGLSCAARFSRIAAEKGVCIISGGARGCDAEAHRAALKASSRTVVFLGGGCDEVYPAEHRSLFQKVVDAGGALVSEYEWARRPLPYMFRERNRLIAGLSKAVLIVEAGLPSGTFSTADEALEAGREVLVVPGAITSDTSAGANRLLYQGALPIVDDESFEEALFGIFGALKRPASLKDQLSLDDPLIAAILAEPLSVEELNEIASRCYGSQCARERLNESLVEAEMLGLIARRPDGRWTSKVQA